MAPSVNDVIRIVAKMAVGADDVQNVFHLLLSTVSGSPTNAALLAEIAAVINALYDTIDGVVSDEVSFDTVECYNLTANEYVGETAFTTLTAGANADITPPQCAPLVLFGTETLNSQGRKFLPPLGKASADVDGTLTAAALTPIGNFASFVLSPTGWTAYDGDFGNYRPLTATFIPYTSSFVRDFFATQRRRYAGSGS